MNTPNHERAWWSWQEWQSVTKYSLADDETAPMPLEQFATVYSLRDYLMSDYPDVTDATILAAWLWERGVNTDYDLRIYDLGELLEQLRAVMKTWRRHREMEQMAAESKRRMRFGTIEESGHVF